MKTKNYLFTLFFLVVAATLSLAQEAYRANIKSFTTSDGLSHLDVYCFEKDTNGILWVGTRDGLNRFDGRKFKVFTKKNGLVYKSVNILYRDGDFLWCVHHNRTTNTDFLSIFNIPEEKVYSLEEYLGKNLPFKQSEIKTIHKIQDALLIKTTQQNTYIYTEKKGLKSLPFIRQGEAIRAVLKNNNFLIIDWDKPHFSLKKVNEEGKEIFSIEKKDLPFIPASFVYQNDKEEIYIAYDYTLGKTNLWLIIDTKGTIKTQKATASFNGQEKKISSYFCKYLAQHNAYWYAVPDTCALIDLKGKSLYTNFSNLKLKNNGSSFIDTNNIWMAHQTDGFVQLTLKKNRFKNLLIQEGKGCRGITKVAERLYVNTYDGLFTIDTTNSPIKKPFSGLALFKDKENNLWFFEDQLIQKNVDLETIASFKESYKDGYQQIWSIYQDKNKLVWFSNLGLKSLNLTTRTIEKVISNGFTEIEKGIVYHFYEKEDGNILLCTTTGLYEMELGKGIIARYWEGGKGKYHIPANDFRHLYFDKSNQSYWLATNESGLIQWKPQTQTSKSYRFNYDAANTIHAVYADEFGFLWLSTENGIIQFEKKTGDFKIYLPKDGTSTHEFNRISHFQDKEGKIYFGGIQGLTTFKPKDFVQDFTSLENIKIIPIEINQYKEKTGKTENVTAKFHQNKELDFYPQDRFLAFIFGLTDYRYTKDAIYYYKLKSIDKDWIMTKNKRALLDNVQKKDAFFLASLKMYNLLMDQV